LAPETEVKLSPERNPFCVSVWTIMYLMLGAVLLLLLLLLAGIFR
jgi:hypothetical protein